MIEKIVKTLSKHVDDALARIDRTKTVQVKFYNNKIAVTKEWYDEELTVFAAKGKKLVLKTIKSKEKMKLNLIVKDLLNALKTAPERPYYFGIANGPFKYKKSVYDKKFESADFVGMAQEAIDEARGRSAGVLYAEKSETELITSRNVHAKDKTTSFEFSIRVFGKNSGHGVSYASSLKKFNPVKAAKEASEIANLTDKIVNFKEGRYDVILHPLIAANLLSYLSYGFSAFEVEAGESFLEGMIGKKVASEKVSLYDDGRKVIAFDDEGRPTKRTKLIEKGILLTYLHNTNTAKKFKAKPTSNAGLLYPKSWFFEVSKGDQTLEEMIENTKKGVYLTNTWYTRFTNYRTGDFSTIPRDAAFLIKNGKIVGTIKNIRITGNALEIFRNIETLGKKKKDVMWWEVPFPVSTPHLFVKKVLITKPF